MYKSELTDDGRFYFPSGTTSTCRTACRESSFLPVDSTGAVEGSHAEQIVLINSGRRTRSRAAVPTRLPWPFAFCTTVKPRKDGSGSQKHVADLHGAPRAASCGWDALLSRKKQAAA
jgi:hypothetical protein